MHRDHGPVGEREPAVTPPNPEAVGGMTMPMPLRKADEPTRRRKRRGTQKRDAAIAMLAYATRVGAENHHDLGHAGQRASDRPDTDDPGVDRMVPSRAASPVLSRSSRSVAERDGAPTIAERTNMIVTAAIGLLAGGPVEFLKALLSAHPSRPTPNHRCPNEKRRST